MQTDHIEEKATWSGDAKKEQGTKTSTDQYVKVRGKVQELNGTSTWACLMKEHALSGDQMVQLRQAIIPAKVQGKPGSLVRVFDPKACEAQKLTIENFESLNEHPHLILYEGYFFGHGGPGDIVIEKRKATEPSFLEQKMQEGSIIEVGMKKEDTTGMKWLKGFGKFMMMGGFLLIIILGAVIFIAVSILTK